MSRSAVRDELQFSSVPFSSFDVNAARAQKGFASSAWFSSCAANETLHCVHYDTIRYDRPTRCYFNVRSKANMRQLNQPYGTDN